MPDVIGVAWEHPFSERKRLEVSSDPKKCWGLLKTKITVCGKIYPSTPFESRGLEWGVALVYFTDLCLVWCSVQLPRDGSLAIVKITQRYRLTLVDQEGREIWTSGEAKGSFQPLRGLRDNGERFIVPSETIAEVKDILARGQSCSFKLMFSDENPECNASQAENDWAELSQHFKSLLVDKQNFDVSLVVSGRPIGAHKAVLAARSSVFDRMFQHDMVEQRTGRVEIQDCDPAAFDVYLQFLYSGTFEGITADNVSRLYYIAAKYDSDTLRRQCLEFMKRNLSVERYCDFVSTVLTGNDPHPSFLEACVQFMVGHFAQISKTSEWQAFSLANSLQANELLTKVVNILISRKN